MLGGLTLTNLSRSSHATPRRWVGCSLSLLAMLGMLGASSLSSQASGTSDADDKTLWESAVQEHSATAYETYLKTFPRGANSDVARERLAALRSPSIAPLPQIPEGMTIYGAAANYGIAEALAGETNSLHVVAPTAIIHVLKRYPSREIGELYLRRIEKACGADVAPSSWDCADLFYDLVHDLQDNVYPGHGVTMYLIGKAAIEGLE